MNPDKMIIIDFGSQYTKLIARKVRECHVYSEVIPCTSDMSSLVKDTSLKGIILSGGPQSVDRPRRRAHREHAGGARGVHQIRNREVAADRGKRGYQARISAVRRRLMAIREQPPLEDISRQAPQGYSQDGPTKRHYITRRIG